MKQTSQGQAIARLAGLGSANDGRGRTIDHWGILPSKFAGHFAFGSRRT